MTEINRESFEAWLFSQPKERTFNYASPSECVVCAFIKETTSCQRPVAGTATCWPNGGGLGSSIQLPAWLVSDERGVISPAGAPREDGKFWLTIHRMQKRYRELFPETHLDLSVDVSKAVQVEAVR